MFLLSRVLPTESLLKNWENWIWLEENLPDIRSPILDVRCLICPKHYRSNSNIHTDSFQSSGKWYLISKMEAFQVLVLSCCCFASNYEPSSEIETWKVFACSLFLSLFKQIRPPLPCPFFCLFHCPFLNVSFVTWKQYFRDFPSLIISRAGINGRAQ